MNWPMLLKQDIGCHYHFILFVSLICSYTFKNIIQSDLCEGLVLGSTDSQSKYGVLSLGRYLEGLLLKRNSQTKI
jgi:hypothetical protein